MCKYRARKTGCVESVHNGRVPDPILTSQAHMAETDRTDRSGPGMKRSCMPSIHLHAARACLGQARSVRDSGSQ